MFFIHFIGVGETGLVKISGPGEMRVGKMGQIVGETGIGEMRVGEMGPNRGAKYTLDLNRYTVYCHFLNFIRNFGIL